MKRIKLEPNDIEEIGLNTEVGFVPVYLRVAYDGKFSYEDVKQLKAQIISDAEKAERLDEAIKNYELLVKEKNNNYDYTYMGEYHDLLKELQQIRDGKK